MEKKFYKLMLIDIASERSIDMKMYFFHPRYSEMNQYLYFNNDCTMMLEILVNPYSIKALIYVYPKIRDDGLVEWRLLRNLTNFPRELFEVSLSPYYFSPSFKYFIDFNPKT